MEENTEKKVVFLDTETDLIKFTKCWVVVCTEETSDASHVFRNIHEDREAASRLEEYLSKVDLLVGHNIINFDCEVLEKFGVKIFSTTQILDTLVCSRLLNYRLSGG